MSAPESTATRPAQGAPGGLGSLWRVGGPFVGLVLLLVLLVATDPIGSLRAPPPIESLAVERVVLREGLIELRVRNERPEPVEIAQVLVNEAYWDHDIDDRRLGRLDATTVRIPYPWAEGTELSIGFVMSTGGVVEHVVEVATETPAADAGVFGTLGLLGVYMGVIPVALGLAWLPALRRARRGVLRFVLAATAGLLAFLAVDALDEGLAAAAVTAEPLNGVGLVVVGAVGTVALLSLVESAVARRGASGTVAGLGLAYLVAVGMGLHNLGEGLAVGAAIATGEVALGTTLLVGFAVHNVTEGVAIAAPLGEDRRPPAWHLVALVLLAGAPASIGAWSGGFAFTPAWAALAFGAAAGAVLQVLWVLGKHLLPEVRKGGAALHAGFAVGLVVMYLTGLLTA